MSNARFCHQCGTQLCRGKRTAAVWAKAKFCSVKCRDSYYRAMFWKNTRMPSNALDQLDREEL